MAIPKLIPVNPTTIRPLKSSKMVETGLNAGVVLPPTPWYVTYLPMQLNPFNSTSLQDKMVQCPDAHVFCRTCTTSYASGLLGAHDANIVCMDQSGCKLPFPDSQLQRILGGKLMDLYNRIKQTKEIEAAGLENLEACPFCDYKVVIENEDEKLLWCANQECLAVSCRFCKKLVSTLHIALQRPRPEFRPGSLAKKLQRFIFRILICPPLRDSST
jgi:hypothetical protein